MKKIFTIILLLMTCFSFSQTYSYSKKVVKASVQTFNGSEYRVIDTFTGPYSFVFQTPRDPSVKRLFTLLRPNEENGPGKFWYGHLKDVGYIERNGIMYKKSIYFDTGSNEQVLVLISNDYSSIVLFRSDDTIWEFSN